MHITFENFRSQVESAGLKVRDCGDEHWQVIGGVKPVNFYPDTKRGPCIYVSGGHKGIHGKHATVDAAIRMAKEGVCQPDVKVPRDKLSNARRRRIKSRIWNRTQAHPCHWCGKAILFFADARLDHIIPLAQGGSHYDDNFCLACEPCDKERGNRAINPAVSNEPPPFDLEQASFHPSEEAVSQPKWVHEQRKEVTL